jgi:hypothetical protein
MRERLTSILSARAFTAAASLILIVGIVAIATVRIGGNAESAPSPATDEPLPEEFNPVTTDPQAPVPRAARVAAAEFILAAAGREDLPKAWKLSHPDLKAQCACTYKQWLTGNIPVQYYPTANLNGAEFGVNESSAGRIVLEVLLTPKAGARVRPQTFFIGLKEVGKGKQQRWLVDYWAPSGSPPVPESP